jgi:hypothetical protein
VDWTFWASTLWKKCKWLIVDNNHHSSATVT